jgi:hypothetical protein
VLEHLHGRCLNPRILSRVHEHHPQQQNLQMSSASSPVCLPFPIDLKAGRKEDDQVRGNCCPTHLHSMRVSPVAHLHPLVLERRELQTLDPRIHIRVELPRLDSQRIRRTAPEAGEESEGVVRCRGRSGGVEDGVGRAGGIEKGQVRLGDEPFGSGDAGEEAGDA